MIHQHFMSGRQFVVKYYILHDWTFRHLHLHLEGGVLAHVVHAEDSTVPVIGHHYVVMCRSARNLRHTGRHIAKNCIHNQHHIGDINTFVTVEVGIVFMEVGTHVAQYMVDHQHHIRHIDRAVIINITFIERRNMNGEVNIARGNTVPVSGTEDYICKGCVINAWINWGIGLDA